ncbi:DinB family protein [Bernardetia sp.]|uniref:DinB family protein n=1 Tax=Bernardetia sp. TaxID=1937974 RepID=UPI0025C30D5A|nr:DinB family protein [Bernardetia sp.]
MKLKQTIRSLFERDIQKVKVEIESYKNEENMWKLDGEILNSAGNLCLHLIGNLNHFIGEGIGKTGYVRQRELEFSQKNISKKELSEKLDEVTKIVDASINSLTEEELHVETTIPKFTEKQTTAFLLLHLHAHLNYHLGQINYHRRLLDK